MKLSEMRSMKIDELGKEIDEAYQELFNLRFRLATMQLRNHCEIHQVKNRIARMKTIVREKELGIN